MCSFLSQSLIIVIWRQQFCVNIFSCDLVYGTMPPVFFSIKLWDFHLFCFIFNNPAAFLTRNVLYLGRAGVGDLISDRMTLLDKLTTRKVHGSGFEIGSFFQIQFMFMVWELLNEIWTFMWILFSYINENIFFWKAISIFLYDDFTLNQKRGKVEILYLRFVLYFRLNLAKAPNIRLM